MHLHRLLPAAFAFVFFVSSVRGDGTLDTSFTPPSLSIGVFDLVTEDDGSCVVVGEFTAVTGGPMNGIVKLTATGSVDATFASGQTGTDSKVITSIVRQPDGKYIVGGAFSTMHGVARNAVARLNADGSVDTSFDPGTGPNRPANSRIVNALLLQPDGKVVIGGTFSTWNGGTRRGLVRLNSNGTLDESMAEMGAFTTFYGEMVKSLALQPSSTGPDYFTIVVGGQLYAQWSGAYHLGVLRLKSDGKLDSTFKLGAGAHAAGNTNSALPVTSVAVQPDGKVLVGGMFSAFSGKTVHSVARINSDGTNDTAFLTSLGSGLAGSSTDAFKVLSQPDGKALIAGFFTSASGAAALGLVRFNADGTRDTGFTPGSVVESGVAGLRLQKDGKILAGQYRAPDTTKMLRRLDNTMAAPGVIQFASATATVTEGNLVTLTVERTGGSAGALAVVYGAIGDTALAPFDYSPLAGSLSWADGDVTSKTIEVHVPLDGTMEADEQFFINLAPVGGTRLGATPRCAVTTVNGDTGTSVQPLVIFRTASESVLEGSTSAVVRVDMSAVSTSTVTVPYTVTGTATAGSTKDFTISPPSPLTFAPGESGKDVLVIINNDTTPEPDETVVITFGTPTGAVLDSNRSTHTITITDNEVKPSITAQPQHVLAYVGQPSIGFSAAATGLPAPTLQWLKNGAAVSGLTGTSIIATNLTLAHAATFSMRASNKMGTTTYSATSQTAELDVVDKTTKTFFVAAGTTSNAVMTVPTAGKLITYEWRDSAGTPLTASSRVLNVGTKTLTIKGVTTADTADYVCRVKSPDPLQFIDVTYHLKVVTEKPVITDTAINLGTVLVSEPITPTTVHVSPTNTATDDRAVASFRADSLPPGIKLDATTGTFSGRCTVAKTYNFKVFAKNPKSETTGVPVTLVVNALPSGITGSYVGSIARDTTINARGGRVDFTVQPTGALSGALYLGSLKFPFSGAMDTSTATSTSCKATLPVPNTTLVFTFDYSSTTGLLSNATITDGSHPMIVTGWRNVWNPAPLVKPYAGYYTMAFNAPPAQTNPVPLGNGYASFTIASTGTLTVSGVLADGTGFSTAGFVGPNGEVLVFQMLYTNKGAVHGLLDINLGTALDYSDNTLTGSANWTRDPSTLTTTNRAYTAGFTDAAITAVGGRYVPVPSTAIVLGLPDQDGNAKLDFSDGGLGANANDPNPDYTLRIKKGGSVVYPVPNTNFVSLTVTPSTGFFKGSFTLNQTNNNLTVPKAEKRVASFAGMIVKHSGGTSGCGHFLLPELSTNTVGTTLTKKHSGQVLLEAPPVVP